MHVASGSGAVPGMSTSDKRSGGMRSPFAMTTTGLGILLQRGDGSDPFEIEHSCLPTLARRRAICRGASAAGRADCRFKVDCAAGSNPVVSHHLGVFFEAFLGRKPIDSESREVTADSFDITLVEGGGARRSTSAPGGSRRRRPQESARVAAEWTALETSNTPNDASCCRLSITYGSHARGPD